MARVSLPIVDDFYVRHECCINCGVPWEMAPALFGEGGSSCVLKRQPATDDEVSLMIEVFRFQDLGCIRYAGTDRVILDALASVGEAEQCDALKESTSD